MGEVPTCDLVPLFGEPRDRRGLIAFCPLLVPQEGRAEAALSDFVPLFGEPQERRGYVVILPSFGPPSRQH